MGKQGKYTENKRKEKHDYKQTSSLPSRPPGFTNIKFDSRVTKNSGFGLKKLEQPPAAQQLEEQPQNFSPVHVSQMLMISPCLQHPSLTPGQKHYLYTVAEAYSEERVRKLICQHYLNVLRRSIMAGVSVSPVREMNVSSDPQVEMCSPNLEDSPKPQKKSSPGKQNTTGKKRLVLPKIDSHRKRSPEIRKKRSLTRNKYASQKPVYQEEDGEEDSVLSDISSLSLDHEDFLYMT